MTGVNLSGYSNQVMDGGRTPILKACRTSTATVKPGYVIQGKTAAEPDVVLASGTIVGGVSSGALGVAKEKGELTLDDVFADNVDFEGIPLGSGTIVRIPLESNIAAIITGDRIVISETTDGFGNVEAFTTASTPDVAELKVASDQTRYNQKAFIGIAMEDSANVAAVRWLRILI